MALSIYIYMRLNLYPWITKYVLICEHVGLLMTTPGVVGDANLYSAAAHVHTGVIARWHEASEPFEALIESIREGRDSL